MSDESTNPSPAPRAIVARPERPIPGPPVSWCMSSHMLSFQLGGSLLEMWEVEYRMREEFLHLVATDCEPVVAAETVGTDMRSVNRLRKSNKMFDRRFLQAKVKGRKFKAGKLWNAVYRGGLKCEDDPRYTRQAELALKHYDPTGTVVPLEGEGGAGQGPTVNVVNVNPQFQGMTEEQLDAVYSGSRSPCPGIAPTTLPPMLEAQPLPVDDGAGEGSDEGDVSDRQEQTE